MIDQAQIVEALCNDRMACRVGPLVDFDDPLVQRLGFRVAALFAVGESQAIQHPCNIGVAGRQSLLDDLQGALEQQLGFRVPPPV